MHPANRLLSLALTLPLPLAAQTDSTEQTLPEVIVEGKAASLRAVDTRVFRARRRLMDWWERRG